jgi:cytoskeletal protein CcmA (bactofilin family)
MPFHKSRAGEHEKNIINTIIGPDSFIQGNVNSGGFTRVDGALQGNLHARGRVVVGENARMRSSITGTTVTIGGVVDGNILASERLVILPTAIVLGNIITRRLEAGDGCLIHGKVRVCGDDKSWDKALEEYRDKYG